MVLLQIDVLGRTWDLHTMIAGALLMIVGSQVVALGLVRPRLRHVLHGREGPLVRPHAGALPPRARAAARRSRLHRRPRSSRRSSSASGSTAASAQLAEERLAILAATLMIVGIQIFFSSFLLSILGLRRP